MFCFCIDWVDVANNVLLKCHINLRLERISECDANVFVALYEAILGEKVPGILVASALCKTFLAGFAFLPSSNNAAFMCHRKCHTFHF
ncbi:hypothetical protein PO909_005864 [Leuciscus waleckii]